MEGRAMAQVKRRRSQVLEYFWALPGCVVGIKACAKAHYWAPAGGLGQNVRLMPPSYGKPYIKRNNADAADAEAISEAVTRHRADEVSRRLASIPGIGPITAMAIAATVPDPSIFRTCREFAVWLGFTPYSHSIGGWENLGRISKQGERYIRHLLYIGAGNAVRFAKARASSREAWIRSLQERRPPKIVIIAPANKMARIA
ncbi:transposase [Ancylobacter sp. MQZ15Z-1]|uniref:Transposase n=2 Tax=Ancylobacter mangrovi TaxID=2972472 RepID=A0A9X2T874_9HYPH|nr:transposase [Ancylobacter mangrovi]MCS0496883.1 transposase [Ancylobacter mangrovi]